MPDKIKIATVWLDGCSGCHMSFLDIDGVLLDIADKIDLVYSPLVDNKVFPEMVDLTLVEGGVSSVDDRAKIIKIRQHTKLLLALGDCAITGNVPAMRNRYPVSAIHERAYVENADINRRPPHLIVPELLPQIQPVHTVVPVDLYLPGCPPPAPLIRDALVALLEGKTPEVSPRFVEETPMSQTITIDPVTRIEGHGKVTIQLNDAGDVEDAHFHVTQLRGFEKFSEGRPFREMPGLMARICGICPVSHLVASAKACDELLAVRIPETAVNLRKILNLAQMVQSHALSVFYLSAPDLMLGMDSDPNKRNIFGMYEADPELARKGVRLRQFGQQVIERLSGKRIHPNWVVAGGVSDPLTQTARDAILAEIPEVKALAKESLDWFLPIIDQFREEISVFANFPTMFMGLINPDGSLEHYDGILRIIGSEGSHLADLEQRDYMSFIGEAVEDHSFLKSPFYRPVGYPTGMYRVGPLARCNMATHAGTPLADAALKEYQSLNWQERHSSFYFHYTRLIEIIYGIEKIEMLLNESNILDTHVQALANANSYDGVGVSEAPRGTLLHHYRIDENGLITWANLIIATGHNNLAMDKGVMQTAKHFIKGGKIEEGMLNRVEAVVRTFDPCLSCSTHAIGQMPLHVDLIAPDGSIVDTVVRG